MIHRSARQTETITVIYINKIITHNSDVNDMQYIFNGGKKILNFISVECHAGQEKIK